MGQQQLILLVLATIIVGLAIVVGLRSFNENTIKSNSDAIVQDVLRMANDAQAWKQKTEPFGGQPLCGTASNLVPCAEDSFEGLSDLNQLGYFTNHGSYTNLNGVYSITSTGGIGALEIAGYNDRYNNCVLVTVHGISDRDIIRTAIKVNDSTANATCT